MTTSRQIEMARRHPWLRAAYYHDEMVRRSKADPKITTDPNAVTDSDPERLDKPDFLIGGNVPVDLIPDNDTSRRAHLERPYITSANQLLTYRPATNDVLEEIFKP